MPRPGAVLQFNHLLLSKDDLEVRLLRAFSQAKAFVETTVPSTFLHLAFAEADPVALEKILTSVARVDHVGFIVPTESSVALLEKLATKSGLPGAHRSYSSMVLAKELGQLLATEAVPTRIFRCSGLTDSKQPYSVEMFIPSANPSVVSEWIDEGRGTHVAFLVHERSHVNEIRDLLAKGGFGMAKFMKNAPIENTAAGTLTAYFDLERDHFRLRVEFVHEKRNPESA